MHSTLFQTHFRKVRDKANIRGSRKPLRPSPAEKLTRTHHVRKTKTRKGEKTSWYTEHMKILRDLKQIVKGKTFSRKENTFTHSYSYSYSLRLIWYHNPLQGDKEGVEGALSHRPWQKLWSVKVPSKCPSQEAFRLVSMLATSCLSSTLQKLKHGKRFPFTRRLRNLLYQPPP